MSQAPEWIVNIGNPRYIKSLTHGVFSQGVVTEETGYFQIILPLGSGSDQDLIEHHSFCLGHSFNRLTRLKKNMVEYQSWSLGDFTNSLVNNIPRLLALDITLHEMRASAAILHNLERLQRNWCDIPVRRLSVESNIRLDSLKKLLSNGELALFTKQSRDGDQYRFTLRVA